MPCEILPSTPAALDRAAAALSAGQLVALPTETVYGLGGNAWNLQATNRVYTVKGRPPTDPLICHVDHMAKGESLWDGGRALEARDTSSTSALPMTIRLAQLLGDHFWPGPLTIVCRASPHLPERVTGGSGYVGLRIPQHPVALDLLRRVPFPVAAPSANTFGHVSPTTAQHVYDDLADRDPELLIVDGGRCGVGIESTVIKLIEEEPDSEASEERQKETGTPLPRVRIELLRRGKITVSSLHEALRSTEYAAVSITVRDTRNTSDRSSATGIASESEAARTLTASSGSAQDGGAQSSKKRSSSPSIAVGPTNSTTRSPPLSCSRSGVVSQQPVQAAEALARRAAQEVGSPMDGPGQLLTHYAPRVPATLITPDSFLPPADTPSSSHLSVRGVWREDPQGSPSSSSVFFPLSTTIVLDFNGILLHELLPLRDGDSSPSLKEDGVALCLGCLAYMDLSPAGRAAEASAQVFDALRWAEQVQGGSNVIFPYLTAWRRRRASTPQNRVPDGETSGQCNNDLEADEEEALLAVEDRLYRAASGMIARMGIRNDDRL